MPDTLIDNSGDKEPHEESHESAEGLEVHMASREDAREIQGKDDSHIDPLCDGSSEAGTLASGATTFDPNGLDPQLRAPLSTSVSGEEGEDRSTSTGEPTSLAKFDVLRFQNGFLEVVEELRMRRAIDSENEERIKQLVTEKHRLQQKLEEECVHSASLTREHDQKEQDQRRKHEERHKQLQEEKTKYELSIEGWDRELRALKDEIRALHLAKYNLEKKVQEQERKLQLQTVSREGHLSQMAQVEQRCSAAFKQVAEITEYMERLERNVKGAMELNRKLQYDNEHQHCLMEGYRTELQACRQQLVEARVRLEGVGLVGGAGDELGPGRARTVEHDLKMQVELGRQLQSQLAGLREEHQTTLLCLKEAHTLIERHVESTTQLSANEVVLQEEMDALRERVGSLEKQLGEEGQRCRETEGKYSREKQEWEEKCSDIENRLKALQADYSALQESYERLQETERATSQNLSEQAKCVREKEEQLLARVREAEGELGQVREQETRREEEWGERVRRLQQALEQSETLLQEREQSLEEKAKQFANLEAKYISYLQQPKTVLLTDVTAEDQTVARTEPSHPTSPSDQPLDKSSQRDKGSPHVHNPPKSPVLSPDIISSSQQLGEALLSPSIIEEEDFEAKKHLTPRIHLEKISLPLNSRPKDGGTPALKENSEQCQTDGSGVDIDAATTDVQNQVPLALDPTEERGCTMESELQEHYSIKETQTPKQDLSALPVQVDSRCQPKLSPPLFECLPSPNNSGASTATKRCAEEITMDLSNTESPPKKQKIESARVTGSETKDETETSEMTVDTVVTVVDPLSTNDSKKLPEHCSQSQPNSTASTQQHDTAEACPSAQPVPYLINIPWKLEIPKRRAMIGKGSTSLGCKEQSRLSTQQQPKLLLLPDHAMPSDLNSKTPSELDNCGLPQQQETDKITLQISPEPQGSSSNIKISESAIATAVTGSETCATSTTSTDGKDTATDSTNTLSQRDQVATAAENHRTNVENAVGYTASATEGEAGSLSILFSEDEDEGQDGLLNTQMSRKVDKVQLFLKMDRLRRPKPVFS